MTEPLVKVEGTRVQWRGVAGWIEAASQVSAAPYCSAPVYKRVELVYRSLSNAHIRASVDEAALATLVDMMARSKAGAQIPGFHSFRKRLRREEIGEILMEARNRLGNLQSGRAFRSRTPGPKLDPARIPDDRLLYLIQHHKDLAVVEAMRAERARRESQTGGNYAAA